MTSIFNRRFWLVVATLVVGLAMLTIGWRALLTRMPAPFQVQDPHLHIAFCSITWGTNHTLLSGDKKLSWFNSKLKTAGLRPITHDHSFSVNFPGAGPAQTTLLSLGYTYDGDASTNDPFNAVLIRPGAASKRLPRRVGSPFCVRSEILCMWNLPADQTNFVGCKLLLSNPENGENMAVLSLR
jgi:hypothetical protein